MTTRRTGLLTALLLTAALLLCMPGLWRSVVSVGDGRVDDRLRPARQRTLTVWLLPGEMGDREVVVRACAAFEKQRPGARVFLRVVSADEFEGETAVLPDVALFETGAIQTPEAFFLPLVNAGEEPSGQLGDVDYAVPLWMHANVLSLPLGWFGQEETQTRQPSLLASAAPAREIQTQLEIEDAPWGLLTQVGALQKPRGVALQQLLFSCPQHLRAQLANACLGKASSAPAATPAPDGLETTLPLSCGPTPTPSPDLSRPARVQTLWQHLRAVQSGEALCACVLLPAVSDQTRYAALCRDGEDARAFVRFLREEAETPGYLPAREGTSDDALTRRAQEIYAARTLPNAFAHTRQELRSLCEDAFRRLEDPVTTLLRLR